MMTLVKARDIQHLNQVDILVIYFRLRVLHSANCDWWAWLYFITMFSLVAVVAIVVALQLDNILWTNVASWNQCDMCTN